MKNEAESSGLLLHTSWLQKIINRRKSGGKTVIAMYTCKDNLPPLLYSGKIKKLKKKKKRKFWTWRIDLLLPDWRGREL